MFPGHVMMFDNNMICPIDALTEAFVFLITSFGNDVILNEAFYTPTEISGPREKLAKLSAATRTCLARDRPCHIV